MAIQRYMWKLIEVGLFDLQVLSFQEPVPEVNIRSLAGVNW